MERLSQFDPEGTLIYRSDGDHYRYYQQICRNGKKKRIYLTDDDLKVRLMAKRLRSIQLQDCQNELKAINAGINKRKAFSAKPVFANEAYRDLLLAALNRWQKTNYDRNPFHKEDLTVEGANGVYMHSKSEGEISWGLADVLLPHRYEPRMIFDGIEVYPDFTIKHPLTGEIILWEHFGKMDDERYSQKTYWKIDLYKKNGFFPDENLIMTFEDKNHPLSTRKIRTVIRAHFEDWLEMKDG